MAPDDLPEDPMYAVPPEQRLDADPLDHRHNALAGGDDTYAIDAARRGLPFGWPK